MCEAQAAAAASRTRRTAASFECERLEEGVRQSPVWLEKLGRTWVSLSHAPFTACDLSAAYVPHDSLQGNYSLRAACTILSGHATRHIGLDDVAVPLCLALSKAGFGASRNNSANLSLRSVDNIKMPGKVKAHELQSKCVGFKECFKAKDIDCRS